MDELEDNPVVFQMAVEEELQIVVGQETTVVTLELLSGYAECFGSELEMNKIYSFRTSSSVAVNTFQGCSIKVAGKAEKACVTSRPMNILPVTLHACLEEMRLKSETENTKGPVSLIVGPTDVGKSTLCRILLNYAARLGRRPLYIDLDVGQSSVSIPGSIGILNVQKASDITEGFNQKDLTVYPFGYKSPGRNIGLYLLLVKKLGQLIQTRLKNSDSNIRHSGIIIDSCGAIRGVGYEAITVAACAFEIDVLFVMEEEKLYLQLKKDMPSSVHVVYVPKQHDICVRSRFVRSQNRDSRLWDYFYGSNNTLKPHSIEITFNEIHIYKVAQTSADSVIDGQNINSDDVAILSVTIGPYIVDQVVGLSLSDTVDKNLIISNIIGFVCIDNVDMESETITLLSPQPGPLPSKILIMGDIRLVEIRPH